MAAGGLQWVDRPLRGRCQTIAAAPPNLNIERSRSRGTGSTLGLRLGEIGAIQVELGNRDHPHLWEIFLERLKEGGRLPDDDETRRAVEIFRGERADAFGGDRINRGNELV